MFTNLSGKIIPVVFVVAVLSGAGYWYTSNFAPPYNVMVTDVLDKSAVVVWETKTAGKATMYFSKNPLFIRFLPLTLPFVHIRKNVTISVNHRIILKNLIPGTQYSFAIGSGPYFYQVSRYTTQEIRQTTPLPTVNTLSQAPNVKSQGLLYGVVRDYRFKAIRGALVVAVLPGDVSRVYSDVTEKEGWFGFYVPEATGSMALQVFNGPDRHMVVPVLWDKVIKAVTIALR